MLLAWAVASLLLAPVPLILRAALAVAGVVAVLALRRLALRLPSWLVAGLAALLVGVVLRAMPEPSGERAWIEPQARMPRVTITGDELAIRDVRNFRYGQGGAVARAAWEERHYDLATVSTAWLGVSPFGGVPGVGHVFVSFGFADGRYLAVSVEARRELGESYGPVRGMFRAFETIYVVGDERDVIGVRANVWRDPVYLYPIRSAPADLRAALLDILSRADGLATQPEFYDTLLNSCSSNLARHVNRVAPGKVPASLKVVFAAFSGELAHELGLLDFDGPFETARERFHINARAAGDVDAGDFSARIRGDG